jgi:hypothetical protein
VHVFLSITLNEIGRKKDPRYNRLRFTGERCTRWNSKAAAVNAISRQLEKVIAALEQLCDTLTKKLDTRKDAALILNGIEKFEFVAPLFF